jgi:hypothetical protein
LFRDSAFGARKNAGDAFGNLAAGSIDFVYRLDRLGRGFGPGRRFGARWLNRGFRRWRDRFLGALGEAAYRLGNVAGGSAAIVIVVDWFRG